MKESFTKIELNFKKVFTFKTMNPHVYWRNVLYGFFVVVIGLLAFSFYLLFQIKNQQIFQVAPIQEEQGNLMNEKLLNKINKVFEEKSSRINEIQSGAIKYKDPSLN